MADFGRRESYIVAAALIGAHYPATAQDRGAIQTGTIAQSSAATEPGSGTDYARTSDNGVGTTDIVVTAQRREQSVQSVPASITALAGAALEKQHITDIIQAVRQVPNLVVDLPGGPSGPPNFTIRGISSLDFSATSSRPIALNLNDSVRNYPIFEIQPFYDLERIEVLRGPQGTLYGRNATGGAINIITHGPDFDNSGYVRLSYGNYDTRQLEAVGNVELDPDHLAARIAVFRTKDDGVFDNVAPGQRNTQQTDITRVRASLRWKPTGSFETVLRYGHVYSTGRDFQVLPINISLDAFPPNFAALPGVNRSGLNYFQTDSFHPGRHRLRTDSLNLQSTWSLSADYTVKSITSYDWGTYSDDSDASGMPIDWNTAIIRPRGRQFIEEVRLLSDYTGPFNWQAGAIYSSDFLNSQFQYRSLLDPECGSFCYFGITPTGTGFVNTAGFRQKRSGAAGYVRAEYKVLPDLVVRAGVRHSRDKLRAYDYTAYLGDNSDTFAETTIPGVSAKRKFHNTSFEAGADYTPVQHVLLYGSFKQGYRMGAVNGSATDTPAEVTIAPSEKAEAFEIGVKSELFSRMLTLNLALSTTKYTDQQTIGLVPGSPFPQLISIPSARIRALEADAALRPAQGLVLRGSLGLTDPTYRRGDAGAFEDIRGNQMANSAKVTASLNGSYDVWKGDAGTLTASANGNYTSKRYFDRYDTPLLSQKGFWVVDAHLNWDAKRYSIGGHVSNLFQQKYFASLVPTQVPWGYISALRGEPRRYSIDATFKF